MLIRRRSDVYRAIAKSHGQKELLVIGSASYDTNGVESDLVILDARDNISGLKPLRKANDFTRGGIRLQHDGGDMHEVLRVLGGQVKRAIEEGGWETIASMLGIETGHLSTSAAARRAPGSGRRLDKPLAFELKDCLVADYVMSESEK